MTRMSPPTDVRNVLITSTVFIPGFKGGGPVRSLVEVLERLPENIVALVVTADRDWGDREPYEGLSGKTIPHGRHRVLYIDPHRPGHLLQALRLVRAQRFELLYANSLWSPWYTMLPVIARFLRIIRIPRLLIAPRGELYAGAMASKSTKKRLALLIWRPILRRQNPTFQVTADQEAIAVKTVFPWATTITQMNSRGREPLGTVVEPASRPRVVFLSRVCPSKNLILALEALESVRQPLEMDIYGTLEDRNYWARCERQIAKLSPPVSATYRGPLPHESVHATLAQYDATVLPTRGENFGHVIVESLSVGCPVVTTRHTPWTDVLHAGGGAAIADDVAAWTEALEAIANRTPAQRLDQKQAALRAYKAWRESVDDTLAVEQVLRDHPGER